MRNLKAVNRYHQKQLRKQKEELERLAAENEDLLADNEQLQHRANRAEADYYNILDSAYVLEEKETGRIFARLIADMLADPKYRGRMQPLIDQVEERLMVRIDERRYPSGIELRIQNRERDGQIGYSVRIPEVHITIWNDARSLQMTCGKRGPVVMPDRPIMVMEEPLPYFSNKDHNQIPREMFVKTI